MDNNRLLITILVIGGVIFIPDYNEFKNINNIIFQKMLIYKVNLV